MSVLRYDLGAVGEADASFLREGDALALESGSDSRLIIGVRISGSPLKIVDGSLGEAGRFCEVASGPFQAGADGAALLSRYHARQSFLPQMCICCRFRVDIRREVPISCLSRHETGNTVNAMSHPAPLHLLPPAARSTRTAPRPSFITAAGRFDLEALMQFAHAEARANVARAAVRGVVRRYAAALKVSMADAWDTARAQRDCARRDIAMAALPAAHSAILAERTSALMIDSTRRMVVELSAIDARALALGVRL